MVAHLLSNDQLLGSNSGSVVNDVDGNEMLHPGDSDCSCSVSHCVSDVDMDGVWLTLF